jgi:NAD(P)-dependent dehydrogenase (short-subunit alcohol dehydrogenase family)
MLIQKLNIDSNALVGKTIIITGGGGGIATEAGKALVYLGANVILAESDEQKGIAAEEAIGTEWRGKAIYHPLDLTSSQSISELYEYVTKHYGCADVIIHNATITPIDSVEVLPLSNWDTSFSVHLRGPIELTQKFLPAMKKQNSGAILFTPSSGAVPYMGAYEVFKTAQVELAYTLVAELENTGIKVFCIGPGLVKTHTATAAIDKISSLMGISVDEFYAMNAGNIVSAEEAGTGFAVSLLFADKYNGSEIGANQALMDAGISNSLNASEQADKSYLLETEQLLISIGKTFDEQYNGWKQRNIFERQWMLRNFKKHVGRSADEVSNALASYISAYQNKDLNNMQELNKLLTRLRIFYVHQFELMQGYYKDQKTKDEYSVIIKGWIADIDSLLN